MEKKYSIGSLFAGIGGFELGLERAIPGAYTLWQVEQEKYCKKVLSKHWPEATIYDDVRNITKNNTKQVDILCGGFPCQDISVAGKGEGLHGKKSGLWWEMHRIIEELQPRAVIMENVAAITIRGLGTVLGSLSEIGYDAEWCTIRASDFGAPHHRSRWFCIAYPRTIGYYLSNEKNFSTHSECYNISNKEEKRESNKASFSKKPLMARYKENGEKESGNRQFSILDTIIYHQIKKRLLPTPLANDHKMNPLTPSRHTGKHHRCLNTAVGEIIIKNGITGNNFQLNPPFVEEMMGFPIGWTELEP